MLSKMHLLSLKMSYLLRLELLLLLFFVHCDAEEKVFAAVGGTASLVCRIQAQNPDSVQWKTKSNKLNLNGNFTLHLVNYLTVQLSSIDCQS